MFYWGGRQQDGASTEEHIAIAKNSCFATAVISDQTFSESPEEVECPWELEHLWKWFGVLDGLRINGMTHGPILASEILKWSEGMKYDISPLELEALLAIDRAYLLYQNKQVKEKRA